MSAPTPRTDAAKEPVAKPDDYIEPHTCPYAQEIHGSDAPCNCTPEQQKLCAEEI